MAQLVSTTCAKCGKPILVNALEIKKEMYPSGIERTYWICPHEGCGQEYTVMLTDEKIRDEFKRRYVLIQSIKAERTERKLKKLQAENRKINKMLMELNTPQQKEKLKK